MLCKMYNNIFWVRGYCGCCNTIHSVSLRDCTVNIVGQEKGKEMAKTLLFEVLCMAFVKYFFAFPAKSELTEVFE